VLDLRAAVAIVNVAAVVVVAVAVATVVAAAVECRTF